MQEIIGVLIMLWLVYSILRILLIATWWVVSPIWRRIDWRLSARTRRHFDRIARQTRRKQRDIGTVYTELMSAADRAADRIRRR